jgi:uncharacterized Tic20 family protein
MTVMLLAAAFLCGIPFGAIIGLVVVWHMTKPDRVDDELDYSDGY